MKNLAGNKEADITIKEELYLAGIETKNFESIGEVPYNFIGKLDDWTFKRAWTYWIASVEHTVDGLPLDIAGKMHEKINPIKNDILGNSIRSGGHCGCPHPKEFGAELVYSKELNEELNKLGVEKKERTFEKISKLANENKLKNFKQYVNCYHIDDQIGLNEFVKTLREFYFNKFKL